MRSSKLILTAFLFTATNILTYAPHASAGLAADMAAAAAGGAAYRIFMNSRQSSRSSGSSYYYEDSSSDSDQGYYQESEKEKADRLAKEAAWKALQEEKKRQEQFLKDHPLQAIAGKTEGGTNSGSDCTNCNASANPIVKVGRVVDVKIELRRTPFRVACQKPEGWEELDVIQFKTIIDTDVMPPIEYSKVREADIVALMQNLMPHMKYQACAMQDERTKKISDIPDLRKK